MKRTRLSDRLLPDYTRGEEIMNMVTHIVGGAMGIAVLTLCVIRAALHSNVYGIVRKAQRMSIIKVGGSVDGASDYQILVCIKHYPPVSQFCRDYFKASSFYILRFHMFYHDVLS
jgi:predicted membrane channel-forming protein YqfA (hemolysin III family)